MTNDKPSARHGVEGDPRTAVCRSSAHETAGAGLSFDPVARGYTTHERRRSDGPCPGIWLCGCATWLEERFQIEARKVYRDLRNRLGRATSDEVRAFLAEAGVEIREGTSKKDRLKKRELIVMALNAQAAAWWPPRVVFRGEKKA